MNKFLATVISALSLLYAAFAALFGCAERPSYVRPNPSKITADLRYDSNGTAASIALISGTANEFWGRISSDGKKILYVSDEKGNLDLFLQDVSAGTRKALSPSVADDFAPAFSPDGERIVFISKRRDAKGDVFVYDLKKEKLLRLTDRDTEDKDPAWLDNASVVYAAKGAAEKSFSIYKISVSEGAKPEKIAADASQPAVCADGSVMAFVRFDEKRRGTLFLMTMSGGRPLGGWRRALADDYSAAYPAFSPDCKRLIFSAFADDENGDGEADELDAAALFSCPVSDGPPANARQLTSSAKSALFPFAAENGIVYATSFGSGLDVAALPFGGEIKEGLSAAALIQIAEKSRSPLDRLLALRRALSELEGASDEEKAGVLLEILETLTDAAVAAGKAGDATHSPAATTLSKLKKLSPSASSQTAALIEIAELRLNALRLHPQKELPAAFETRKKLREIAGRLKAIADGSETGSKPWIKAELRLAAVMTALKQSLEASEILDKIKASGAVDDKTLVKLLSAKADLYAAFGDAEAAAEYLLIAARDAGEGETASKLSSLALTKLETPSAPAKEAFILRKFLDKWGGAQSFRAVGLFRLARLQSELGRTLGAAETLNELVSKAGYGDPLITEAKLKLAELSIKSAQEDKTAGSELFENGIEYLSKLAQDCGKGVYCGVRARQLLLRLGLLYSENLERAGNPGGAFKTAKKLALLLDDDRLAAYAYRRLASLANKLGKIVPLAKEIEKSDMKSGRQALYWYVKSLLASYYYDLNAQSDFARIEEWLDRSINMDSMSAPPRLLRGWLLEIKEFYLGVEGKGCLEDAIKEYETARELHERALSTSFEADVSLNLGNAYYLLNNRFSWAYRFYKERLDLSVPFASDDQRLIFLGRLGRAALLSNHAEEAIPIFEEAIDLALKLKKKRFEAELAERLAFAHYLSGDFGNAGRIFKKALDMRKELKDDFPQAVSLRNIALSALNAGDSETAKQFFEKALEERLKGALKEVDYDISLVAVGVLTPEIFPLGFGTIGESFLMSGLGAALYAAEGGHSKVKKSLDEKGAALSSLQKLNAHPSIGYRLGAVAAQKARLLYGLGDFSGAIEQYGEAAEIFDAKIGGEENADPLFLKSAILADIGAAQSLLFGGFAGGEKARRDKLLALYDKFSLRAKKAAELKKRKIEIGSTTMYKMYNALGAIAFELAVLAANDEPLKREEKTLEEFLEKIEGEGKFLGDAKKGFAKALEIIAADEFVLQPNEPEIFFDRLKGELFARKNLAALYRYARDEKAEEEENNKIDALIAGYGALSGALNPPDAGKSAVESAKAIYDKTPFDWATEFGEGRAALIRSQFEAALDDAIEASDAKTAFELSEMNSERIRRDELLISNPKFARDETYKAYKEYVSAHGRLVRLTEGLEAKTDEEDEIYLEYAKKYEAAKTALSDAKKKFLSALGDDAGLFFGQTVSIERAKTALPSGSAMARYVFGRSRSAVVIIKRGEEPALVKLAVSPSEAYEAAQSEDEESLDKALFAPIAALIKDEKVLAACIDLPVFPKSAAALEIKYGKTIAFQTGASAMVAHSLARNFFYQPGASLNLFKYDEAEFEKFYSGEGILRLKGAFVSHSSAPQSITVEWSSESGGGSVPLPFKYGRQGKSAAVIFDSLRFDGKKSPVFNSLANRLLAAGAPSAVFCDEKTPRKLRELYADLFLYNLESMSPAAAHFEASSKIVKTVAAEDKSGKIVYAQPFACYFYGYAGLSNSEMKELAQSEAKTLASEAAASQKSGKHLEAVKQFERLLPILKKAGMTQSVPQVYSSLMVSYAAAADWDKSIHFAKLAMEAAEEKKDDAAAVKFRQTLATLYARKKAFDEALAANAKVLDYFVKAGKQAQIAETTLSRGLILEQAYRFEKAKEAFFKAYEIAKKIGDPNLRAASARGVARLDYLYLGDFQEALTLLEEIKSVISPDKRNDLFQVGIDKIRAMRSLGRFRGALKDALTLKASSLAALKEETDKGAEKEAAKLRLTAIQITLETAYLYWQLSDYGRAVKQEAEAYALASEANEERFKIQCLNILGLILSSKGDRDGAVKALAQALEIAEKHKFDAELATIYSNMGTAEVEDGNSAEALRLYRKALAMDELSGQTIGLIYDRANLAITYMQTSDDERIEEHAKAALALIEKIPSPTNEIKALLALGKAKLNAKKYAEAKEPLLRCRSLAKRMSLMEWRWKAALLLGKTYEGLDDSVSASEYYVEGVNVLSKLPYVGISKKQAQGSGAPSPKELYEGAARLFAKDGKSEEAFKIFDRYKSRLLLDMLGGSVDFIKDAETLKMYEMYEEAASNFEQAEAEADWKKGGDRAEAVERAKKASETKDAALLKLASKNPFLPLLAGSKPVSYSEVWGALESGQAAVFLYQTEAALYRWTIMDSSAEFEESALSESDAAALVSGAVGRLKSLAPMQDAPAKATKALLGGLLDKLAKKSVKKLIFVSSGVLTAFPPALFEDEAGYLSARFAYGEAPSGAFIKASSFASAPQIYDSGAAFAFSPLDGGSLPPIPFADKEIERISSLLPYVQPYFGLNATAGALKNAARNAKILHVAAHAQFDGGSPMEIKFALSGESGDEFSYVSLFDLLSLGAGEKKIAVISSCGFLKGESNDVPAIDALAYSTGYIGAAATAFSRFETDDLRAASFMKRYYRALAGGMSPQEAMKSAQSYFARTSHPSTWAVFSLIGK